MKVFRKLIPLLLAVMLLVCLLALPAQAAEYTFNATVGETAYFIMFSDETDFIEDAYIYEGSIPGMWLENSGDVTLGLAGTSTTAGTFTVYITATTSNKGSIGIVATVKVAQKVPSAGTPVVTKNPTSEKVVEGDSVVFIARADNAKSYSWAIAIADAIIDCNDLPNYLGGGVKVSGANSEKLVISNVPKSMDGCYVWCLFVGAEESVESTSAKLSVTPLDKATPVVTKNPQDVTVEEGASASFSAEAKYVKKMEWQLVSPDGVTYNAAQAQNNFKPLQVSGGDSKTLELKNIPTALDGYKVLCKFTAGETVSSKTATLHVTAKPTEPPTEVPTEAPTEAATELPTEVPTEALIVVATEAATEAPVDTFGSGPQKDNTLTIALIICISVVLLCGIAAVVIIFILKNKRR